MKLDSIFLVMTTASVWLLPPAATGFHPPMMPFTKTRTNHDATNTMVMMNNNKNGQNLDERAATTKSIMTDFFMEYMDWHPLFRSMSAHDTVPAMIHLTKVEGGGEATRTNDGSEDDTKNSYPWNLSLDAIPSNPEDKQVIGAFLDQMQQSLLDLPTEFGDEDMPFIVEGRRLLAISRFQVIRTTNTPSSSLSELLFSVCWSELAQLSRDDQPDTGSLIVLPDYYNNANGNNDDTRTLDSLQHFLSTKMEQPLQWLGLDPNFEITHLQYGDKSVTEGGGGNVPALRLLHKLSDIPTLPNRNEENYNDYDDDDDE